MIHLNIEDERAVSSEVGKLVFVKDSLDHNVGVFFEHGGLGDCHGGAMTNIRDNLEVGERVTSHTRVISADLSNTEGVLSDSLFFTSSAGDVSEETGLQGFDKAGLAARQVLDEKVDAVSEN